MYQKKKKKRYIHSWRISPRLNHCIFLLIFSLSLWFRAGLFESWVKICGLKNSLLLNRFNSWRWKHGKKERGVAAHDLREEMWQVENRTCRPYNYLVSTMPTSHPNIHGSPYPTPNSLTLLSDMKRIKVDGKSIMVKPRFQTNPLQNTSSWFMIRIINNKINTTTANL